MEPHDGRQTRLIPVFIVGFLLFGIVSHLAWARFVSWHAGVRTPPADTYHVDVYTPVEYAQLADPAVADVRLANGHTLAKGPAWDAVAGNFKPTRDGRHSVTVRTLGTAHAWPFLRDTLLPLAIEAAIGIGVVAWSARASPP